MNRNDWKNILGVIILVSIIPLFLMAILAIYGYHWQSILAVTAIVAGIPMLFITPLILALSMPNKDKAEKVAVIGGCIAVILSFIIFKIVFPNIF